jgi:membrane protease YdiL (CAAX protease family)
MNSIASKVPGPQASDTLLASRRHTLIFFAICLAVTVVSALNANRGAPPGASAGSNQMLQLYVFLIGMEWLWVRFVYKGMQAHGRSLFEFVGHPWFTLRQMAGDLMYAALALGFSYTCFIGIDRLLGHGAALTNPLLPAVPSGAAGIVVWIGLSLSAGICEEIVFRGYLQRQLAAISGSTSLAILGQAIVFGIAHGYEGVGAVLRIVVYGLAFGMLAHAAWDILAGLDLI